MCPLGPYKCVGTLISYYVCTNNGVWVCTPRPCTCTGTNCGLGALVGDGVAGEIVGSSMVPAVRAADGDRVRMLVGRVVGMLVCGVVGMLVGKVLGMLVGGLV